MSVHPARTLPSPEDLTIDVAGAEGRCDVLRKYPLGVKILKKCESMSTWCVWTMAPSVNLATVGDASGGRCDVTKNSRRRVRGV
jgi:hypothetical protein